jgi:hypothetical protein
MDRTTRIAIAAMVVASVLAATASAGNCLVQGGKKIGDCRNVQVGPAKPLIVSKSGSFNGNYASVTIKRNAIAHINGNTDNILIEEGANLTLSGNADDITVYGRADISGNAGWITVKQGGQVTIRGIVSGVSGDGKITRIKGAIVGGHYIQ